MNIINKHIFLIFLLVLPLFAFSQYSVLPTPILKEVNKLNEKIKKSLKNYNTNSSEDTTLLSFSVYYFCFIDSISKSELVSCQSNKVG